MRNRKCLFFVLLAAALLLAGCTIRTVDEMYSLPKRSEDYKHLQSAIDGAMAELEYCAPLSGENQQTVQMADLDGDGSQEYLLFAKGTSERPLRILIFDDAGESFSHVSTIESNGSGFDLVEYVQMDDRPGVELVVGCQLSDQLIRSVSVYSFRVDEPVTLVSTNYTKFLTMDMDGDSKAELFVLRPGQTETDNGVAEMYSVRNGTAERSNEVNMSGPVDKLKRIISGNLHDGESAIYVASTVEDTALITDVFAFVDGMLKNVSFSNESGTSVRTLRNYYVYADDIDNDGTVELPDLITLPPLFESTGTDRHELIRWYTMKADGSEVDKVYTYHNFMGGWYVELDNLWGPRLVVDQRGNQYEFHIMSEDMKESRNVFSVFAFTGQNRDAQAVADGRFVLLKTESVTYSASIYESADLYSITQDVLIRSFRLIQHDWKTGET